MAIAHIAPPRAPVAARMPRLTLRDAMTAFEVIGFAGYGDASGGDLSLDTLTQSNLPAVALTHAQVDAFADSVWDAANTAANQVRGSETLGEAIGGWVSSDVFPNAQTKEQIAGFLDNIADQTNAWREAGHAKVQGWMLAPSTWTPDAQVKYLSAVDAWVPAIKEITGWAGDANLTSVLKQTAAQTGKDLASGVGKIAWVWYGAAALAAALAAAIVWSKFGGSPSPARGYGALRGKRKRINGTLMIRSRR